MVKNSKAIETLSVTQQEYIETIYSLCEYHNHAHTKAIARELNVSMPSVVDALQLLSKSNLINYQARQPVTLTPSGKEVAKTLKDRHKALADFFSNVLGLIEPYSEKIACCIEHVVDDELKGRISAFNSFLKKEKDATSIIKKFRDTL